MDTATRVRHWTDAQTGRRWLLAISDQGIGRVGGHPVRLIWFARLSEFWSTELYLSGDVLELSDDVLHEHLERAQEGWFQARSSVSPG